MQAYVYGYFFVSRIHLCHNAYGYSLEGVLILHAVGYIRLLIRYDLLAVTVYVATNINSGFGIRITITRSTRCRMYTFTDTVTDVLAVNAFTSQRASILVSQYVTIRGCTYSTRCRMYTLTDTVTDLIAVTVSVATNVNYRFAMRNDYSLEGVLIATRCRMYTLAITVTDLIVVAVAVAVATNINSGFAIRISITR